MEILCGGCGRTLTVEDDLVGGVMRCPHCGRAIRAPGPPDEHDDSAPADLHEAPAREELADEFVTRARLALRKKLLVICGECGERLTVEQRLAGKVARCPACGEQIRIPAPATYEEPLEAEELMADAGPSGQDLDVAERSPAPQQGAASEASASAPPAPAPHRPPPGEAISRAVPSAPPVIRGRRGVRLHVLVLALSAGVVLAGLAGLIAGYLWGRPGPAMPADQASGKPAPKPEPPEGPERHPGPAPTSGPAPVVQPLPLPGPDQQPTTAPVPAPPSGPSLRLAAARMKVLGGDGFVPAPLGKVFLEVTAELAGPDRPLRVDSPGPGVTLETPAGAIPSLGVRASDSPVPVPARARRLTLQPGASQTGTFVFLVPENLTAGTVRVEGVGRAELPALGIRSPPPDMAIVGSYQEAARYLGLSLDDPVMVLLRDAPSQRVLVAAKGTALEMVMLPVGLRSAVRPGDNGVYTVTLGGRECRLRLVEPDGSLILYLDDRPYHQIIYRRQ